MTAPVSNIRMYGTGSLIGIMDGTTGTHSNPAILATNLGGLMTVSNIPWYGTGSKIAIKDGTTGTAGNPAILQVQPFSSGGVISAMRMEGTGSYLAVVGNGTAANPYSLVINF